MDAKENVVQISNGGFCLHERLHADDLREKVYCKDCGEEMNIYQLWKKNNDLLRGCTGCPSLEGGTPGR